MYLRGHQSVKRHALAQKQRREKPLSRKEMRKIDCPLSLLFDRKHLTLKGDCGFRHTFFAWEGVGDNRVGLLSDSICKWVRTVPHLNVQAIPGLTLLDAVNRISDGTFKVSGFEALILFMGSNDLDKPPAEIARMMNVVVSRLRSITPTTLIGICLIIPRPAMTGVNADKNRRKTNQYLKAMCKRRNCVFLDAFQGVTTNGIFDRTLYALDDIHLNWHGIERMRIYMRGAACTMLDRSHPCARRQRRHRRPTATTNNN